MAKILVIDDDRRLRKRLREVVIGEGWEVKEAKSSEEAIRLINENGFDLVVTDLRLGANDLAGFDVLQAAKEKDIYTQVIVVTSWHTVEKKATALDLGAFDYVDRLDLRGDYKDELRKKIPEALAWREKLLREGRRL